MAKTLNLMKNKSQLQKLTDEEIVQSLKETKDTYLFGVLYDRYSGKVYQKCLSFVKDNAIAADLTQDVFVKVYVNLENFQFKSKLSTWIYSVAYNICIDYLRQAKRKNLFSQLDLSAEYATYKTEEVSDERILAVDTDVLKELLERIRPEDKMLLLLKYQDKVPVKEIQQLLHLSESAVKMRLKRAKQKLLALHEQHKQDKRIKEPEMCSPGEYSGLIFSDEQ